MSILFSSSESPLEAMFSPWFLRSGLSGAHNLTASRLERKDPYFHLRQTLFVEKRIARKQCLLSFIFGLTRFVFLDVLSLFHIVPYRNLAV